MKRFIVGGKDWNTYFTYKDKDGTLLEYPLCGMNIYSHRTKEAYIFDGKMKKKYRCKTILKGDKLVVPCDDHMLLPKAKEGTEITYRESVKAYGKGLFAGYQTRLSYIPYNQDKPVKGTIGEEYQTIQELVEAYKCQRKDIEMDGQKYTLRNYRLSLTLDKKEGYAVCFVDEGDSMMTLRVVPNNRINMHSALMADSSPDAAPGANTINGCKSTDYPDTLEIKPKTALIPVFTVNRVGFYTPTGNYAALIHHTLNHDDPEEEFFANYDLAPLFVQ